MPLRLETLGRFALRKPDGETIQLQRRQLALLAIVASAGKKGVRRDTLIGYLWPENTPESARHSLDQLLYSIRRSVNDDILSGTDPVTLNNTLVDSDVAELRNYCEEHQHADAAALYHGPFLEGFHLGGAAEFGRWQDGERARLDSLYTDCLDAMAKDAASKGNHSAAAEFRQRIADVEPLSARHALAFMQSLAAAGDIPKALDHARSFESLVRDELGIPVDPSISAFATELRKSASNHSSPQLAAGEQSFQQHPAELVRGSTPASPEPPAPPSSKRSPRLAIFGIIAVALLLGGWYAVKLRTSPSDTTRRTNALSASNRGPTIAVLAFENASSDSAVEYFSYGLTDALIDRLTESGTIRVIQGPTAYILRGHRTDTRAIADSLAASSILAGGVLIENGLMDVSVKLIDGADGSVKWSRTYRGQWKDRFVIQDSLEQDVPRELAAQIAGANQIVTASRPPKTHRAYELYLRGRHIWSSPQPKPLRAMQTAIDYFNAALKEDSTYAEAYAGLAASYTVLGTGVYADFDSRLALDSARAAAAKAMALNPSLPEAHLTFGYVALLYDHDWEVAERELDRARALNPYYSREPLWPSVLYEWTGDYPRAVVEARKTVSTDPLSASALVEYGRALFFAGSDREAKIQIERARALDSTAERLNMTSGEIFMHAGNYDLAEREFDRFARRTNQSSRALAFVSYLAATRGDRPKAEKILADLNRRHSVGQTTDFDLAIAYAGLQQYDTAIQLLNRAYSEHSIWPIIMDPTFAPLRKDPHFAELKRTMKLK